jgi:Carboxypeptidase regulatory-like domain/TonB dependent receptor
MTMQMLKTAIFKVARYACLSTLCLLALSPFTARPLWSQAVGAISGTVQDSSGAVVPQATVSATRTDTGVTQTAVTNGAGLYTFSNLVVGTYNVTVDAAGFSSQSISGVTLDVSQQRSVNFTLVVAGSTQTAVVTAAEPLMNTSDGQLAGLVTQQQLVDMPLNGRSIQNLVLLQPGMAANQGRMGWLAPQWASNGNRGETEVAQLDGADASDAEMGTVQFWNFNVDAIAEFKVLQANYSAEFGQGGGSVTQIVTKSGTNRLHGGAYEFLRNNALDARNYFSTSIPPLHRNEFGADLGGPIIKNRLFFEGEYAGLRETEGEPTIMSVPTAAERTGLVTIGSYQYQVPLNPVAATVLNAYPLPNQPSGQNGPNTYNIDYSVPSSMNQFSVRIDDTISPKDTLFGRATYMNNTNFDNTPVAAIESPEFSDHIFNDPRNYAIGETHIFTPNLVSVALFAVNRQIEGDEPATQTTTLTSLSNGGYSNYGAVSFITKYIETYYNPSERISWNKGRHSITAGIQFRYGQDNGIGVSGEGPNGVYTFEPGTPLLESIPSTNGGPTILAGTGSPSDRVSLMEGADYSYERSTPIPGYGPPGGIVNWGLRVWNLASYIQDNFRMNNKFTLNLGLRYEYQSVPYEIRSRLGAILDQGPQAGTLVVNPQPLYKADRANFAPRLGFAYQFSNKTVLRGGYAIFTNIIPTVYPDQAAVLFPIESTGILTSAPYSLTPLAVSLPNLTSTTGTVIPPAGGTTKIPGNTPVNYAPIAAILGNLSGDWASPEMKNGYTQSTNLTLEQQLPSNIVFTVSGVATDSNTQFNPRYPNGYTGAEPAYAPYSAVTPGLGNVQLFYNQGILHYLALQTQVRKNSRNVQLQANYTWASDLTDNDDIFSGNGNGGDSPNNPSCINPCEYGPAMNNVRNRFIANATYLFPEAWGSLPRMISQGWEMAGIFNVQSGNPFSITSPYGTLQYGVGGDVRPFLLQNAPRNPNHGVPQYFSNSVASDPGAYWSVPTTTSPQPGIGTVQTAPGDLGRNTYTGPSWWNLDFSVFKNTTLPGETTLQLRAEFFNIFNHPTFNSPTQGPTQNFVTGGQLTSPTFGNATATASTERQIQLGVRLLF